MEFFVEFFGFSVTILQRPLVALQSSNYDLKHIDPEFTQEPVPASVTGNGQSVEFDHNRNIFKPRASLDNAFAGFTYVPPIEGL